MENLLVSVFTCECFTCDGCGSNISPDDWFVNDVVHLCTDCDIEEIWNSNSELDSDSDGVNCGV